MKPERLFSSHDLHAVLEGHKAKIPDKISTLSFDRLISEDFESLVYEIAEEFRVEPIILDNGPDSITVDTEDTKVDVSRDPMRAIFDRSRPFYIDGTKVKYFVPFTGDPELFKCRPNTFTVSFPYASISGNELVFEFNIPGGEVALTHVPFDRELQLTNQWLGWIRQQLENYNEELSNLVRPQLERRLSSLKTSKAQTADLGFKIREKPAVAESANAKPISESPSKSAARREAFAAPQPKSEAKKYDVALSFAGEDREYVDKVAQLLRNDGIEVFYDKFEKVSLWGKNLGDHLESVYSKQSKFIVMFISKHYALKSWPNHERKSAQGRAIKMQEDCILPVRFDHTEIPGMPSSIGFIEANQHTPEELASLIAEKVRT